MLEYDNEDCGVNETIVKKLTGKDLDMIELKNISDFNTKLSNTIREYRINNNITVTEMAKMIRKSSSILNDIEKRDTFDVTLMEVLEVMNRLGYKLDIVAK